jgi:hypothetical protein
MQVVHKVECWVEVFLHCGEGHVHVAIAQLGKLSPVRLWDVYEQAFLERPIAKGSS